MIKRTVEQLISKTNLPILGLFALYPNSLSKPHTGAWRFLLGYYKQQFNMGINQAVVVSNNGGLLVEREKRNGLVDSWVAYTDIDRAFAHNIGVEYYTIDEYLDLMGNNVDNPHYGKRVKFAWDKNIIPPNTRLEYCHQILQLPQVNIFKELGKLQGKDSYVIMIMGAPRCGKTKLALEIIQKWQASTFGEYNAVQRLCRVGTTKASMYNNYCKLVKDRISIVLDGSCDTKDQRKPFLSFIKDKNIGVLFIEVSVGYEMAKVFNHACVEEATDETVMLYKTRDYIIHKSSFERPKHGEFEGSLSIVYYPTIEQRKSVMQYRY
jgi:hypothetical protein